jgi:hypothetical protein
MIIILQVIWMNIILQVIFLYRLILLSYAFTKCPSLSYNLAENSKITPTPNEFRKISLRPAISNKYNNFDLISIFAELHHTNEREGLLLTPPPPCRDYATKRSKNRFLYGSYHELSRVKCATHSKIPAQE